MTDTRPTFSRITEGRSNKAWKAAIPAVVVVVAFVALLAYLASSMSSYEQKAMAADRENQQLRDQQAGMVKQIGEVQKQAALLNSPGRTTVILQASEKKGDNKTWAAATWGESPEGKTWMHVNAYGLGALEQGKAYHVWFTPQSGDPINIGNLDLDDNSNGALLSPANLPPVDQGKALQITLDDTSAKEPGEVIARADLPKLTPRQAAPPSQQPGQARTGETTQPMHKEPAK